MITPAQAAELVGAAVHVQGGGPVGTVRRVLVDDGSGWPSWALVDLGLLRSSRLLPLSVCDVDEAGAASGDAQTRLRRKSRNLVPRRRRRTRGRSR